MISGTHLASLKHNWTHEMHNCIAKSFYVRIVVILNENQSSHWISVQHVIPPINNVLLYGLETWMG